MVLIQGLRDRLRRMLPSPRLRDGQPGQGLRRPIQRIIVFGRHPNPTADYYFAARLAAPGMPEYHFADIRKGKFDDLAPDGTFVILCRYASHASLRWIERHHARLAGVGLFLDDDIPSMITASEAGLGYRLFLFFRALMPLRRLNRHLDIVWASTPQLATRLRGAHARILPPAPPDALWNVPSSEEPDGGNTVTLAYHATATHIGEHGFLQPIIADVLAVRPTARFEVFAEGATAALWKDMERVTIRKPLPWPAYLAEASKRRIDIMLVPLCNSLINDCRAPTKRIDVARARAAGVFSVSHAYGEPDGSGEILLPNDRSAWRNAILHLIDDEQKRAACALATRERVAAMTRLGETGLDIPGAFHQG